MPAPSPKLRSVRVVPEEGPPPADLPDGIILPRRPSASVIDLSKQWRRGLWRQATAPAGTYFIGLLRRLIPKFHPGLERGYASYKLQGVRGVQQGICLVLSLFFLAQVWVASIDSLQYADEWSDIGVMQVMSLVIVLFCHMATLAVLAGHRPSEDQIRRLEVAGDVPHSDWYFIATGLVSAVVISLPPDRLLKLFHNRSWRETMRDWERLDPKGFASVYDGTQCDAAHILNSSSGAQQCAITVNYETLHVVLLILSWLHMVGGRVLFGKLAVAGSLSWAIYVVPRIVLGDLDARPEAVYIDALALFGLLLAFGVVARYTEIMLRRDFLAAQRAAVSYIDVSKRHDKVQEELDKTLTPLKMRRDRQMLKLASPMERVLDLLYGLRESGLLRDEEAQEQLQDVLAILEKAQDAARSGESVARTMWKVDIHEELTKQESEGAVVMDSHTKANFLEWTGSASAVNLVGTPKTASIKTSPSETPPPSREPPSGTLVDNLQTSALQWDYDVVELSKSADGFCLRLLFPELLRRHGLLDLAPELGLKIDKAKLNVFIFEMEQNYGNNPYHNARHGADVLLAMHNFLLPLSKSISPLQMIAALFAAAAHDFMHPGTSNAFESKVDSELAILYHDESPLESHHLASAFSLLMQHNFACKWSRDNFVEFRKLVTKLVLMTDLKQHFDFISVLNAEAQASGSFINGDRSGSSTMMRRRGSEPARTRDRSPDRLNGESPAKSRRLSHPNASAVNGLLLTAAIKVADLSHTMKPWAQHERWSLAIQEEFFLLGDRERNAGLQVAPMLCRHRDAGTLAKSQLGFIEYMCAPLLHAVEKVFPHASFLDEKLEANRLQWESRVEKKSNGF